MQDLQTLIALLEKGRKLHISVLDLSGILDLPLTSLTFESTIHSKDFCSLAKTTEKDLTKIKFTKYPNENTYFPLINKNSFEAGMGYNSVIKDNGVWYAVYHGRDLVRDERLTGDDRTARICKLELNGEKLTAIRFENKL